MSSDDIRRKTCGGCRGVVSETADVPGTAMTFAGLSNEMQRADVIVYLTSLSKSPLPLTTAQKEGESEKK